MCVLHRWPFRGRRTRAHVVQSRIVGPLTRSHAHIWATQQHSRSPIYLPGVYIHICIYKYISISDLCVPIYWRTYTHAQNVTGRIVGTRNRTHVYMEAMHPRAHSQPIRHRSIHHLLRVPPVIRMKTMIYKYTHVALYT